MTSNPAEGNVLRKFYNAPELPYNVPVQHPPPTVFGAGIEPPSKGLLASGSLPFGKF